LGGNIGSLTDPAFREFVINNMRAIKDRYLGRQPALDLFGEDLLTFKSDFKLPNDPATWQALAKAKFNENPLWASQWKKEPQFKGFKKPAVAA